MPRIKKDPNNPKRWMIDTTVKLPDGTWAHLGKKGYKTRADADADYQRQASLFRHRRGFKYDDGSFSTLCQSFLSHMKDRRKPTTFHDMERDIRSYIEDPFEGMSVDEVYSGDSLSRWRSAFLSKTSSIGQKRVNWILHHFEILSRYAFETGSIGESGLRLSMLASERVRERLSPKTVYVVWSFEQYQKFISTFDDGDRYIVLFQWLFFSGCRIGEALALQWSDVNFGKNEVSITKNSSPGVGTGRTEIFTPKTSAGVRIIAASDFMMSQLRMLRDNNSWSETDFVFFGKSPVGRMTVRRCLDDHTAKSGLPRIKIHEIRHTVNTWLLSPERTTDELKAITQRLGRSSLKTTMDVYFHAHQDTDRRIAGEIDVSKKKD